MRLVYFSKTFNFEESSAWNFIMLLSAEYATGGPSTLSTCALSRCFQELEQVVFFYVAIQKNPLI